MGNYREKINNILDIKYPTQEKYFQVEVFTTTGENSSVTTDITSLKIFKDGKMIGYLDFEGNPNKSEIIEACETIETIKRLV